MLSLPFFPEHKTTRLKDHGLIHGEKIPYIRPWCYIVRFFWNLEFVCPTWSYIRDIPSPIIRPWSSLQRQFYVYVKAIFRIEALVLCSGKIGNKFELLLQK